MECLLPHIQTLAQTRPNRGDQGILVLCLVPERSLAVRTGSLFLCFTRERSSTFRGHLSRNYTTPIKRLQDNRQQNDRICKFPSPMNLSHSTCGQHLIPVLPPKNSKLNDLLPEVPYHLPESDVKQQKLHRARPNQKQQAVSGKGMH